MADFADIGFDEGLYGLWDTTETHMYQPSQLNGYPVPLAGTKRVADNVIAETQPAPSGLSYPAEYRAEHIDPRNICCSLPNCCPDTSCDAVPEARPSKRRAVNAKPTECHQAATFSIPEPTQDHASSDTLHDTFCRGFTPCASPECEPSSVCYDPHCDQVQECADQCSDPECLKGVCPDTQCFCSKCCRRQSCPLEPLGDECRLAHSPPDTTGTVYCFNNAPCPYTGFGLSHPQVPSFNGYLCPSTNHSTSAQGAISAASPFVPTPALSPTNYTSVESVLSPHSSPAINPGHSSNGFPQLGQYQSHGDDASFQLPNNVYSSANQDSSRGWDVSFLENHKSTVSYGHISAGYDSIAYGQNYYQPSSNTMSWNLQAMCKENMIPGSQVHGATSNLGMPSWPHNSLKIEPNAPSAEYGNKLDFLASAAQQNLVKKELQESSNLTDGLSLHQPSANQSPDPAPCVCKWQHMPGRPCLETFDTPERLHRHLKAAHVDNCMRCLCQWEGCESCDKDFKQRSKLSRHLLGHAGYRPYACSFSGCNKTFATNQAKDNHERTHTGLRPYVCQECGYTTTTHTQLYTHINALHEKRKRHKCRFCDFTCADSSNLSKHERTHQTLRPYRCPHEGCTFKPDCRWENLKRHLRRSNHCPELLVEGSEANRLYREKVKKETEEWQRRNEGNPLAAGGRRRSKS